MKSYSPTIGKFRTKGVSFEVEEAGVQPGMESPVFHPRSERRFESYSRNHRNVSMNKHTIITGILFCLKRDDMELHR